MTSYKHLFYLIKVLGADPIRVSGYAVKSDLPIRYCLRKEGGYWIADHYDTGYKIPGKWESFPDAVVKVEEILLRNIKSGHWHRVMGGM